MWKYCIWICLEDFNLISDVCNQPIMQLQEYKSFGSGSAMVRVELLITREEILILKLRCSKSIHFIRIYENELC